MAKKIVATGITVGKDTLMVVRLTPYLDNELNRISQEWGTPRSEIIRVVLMNFISEMNDSVAQRITDRIESLRHERID